ncbi:MAG: DUF4124 domain-containing protein [Xanthomonadales bacterium]|nr:DUF4124 domain-containing protein [Xanthomonadales bacterium]
MKRILLTAVLGIALSAAAFGAENVYRWTDENGKVHYGRTLPPEAARRPYDILSPSGVVIERVTDPLARQKPKPKDDKADEPEPLFTDDEIRLRSDRLLMLRYHSEDDIRDAMNVEISQLGYDARLINQSMSSALNTLSAQVSKAANRERAGMPPDEQLELEIRQLRNRLRGNEAELQTLRERELAIREQFEVQLERYRYLANGGAPGSIPPEEG